MAFSANFHRLLLSRGERAGSLNPRGRLFRLLILCLLQLFRSHQAFGNSVLTHEAIIDAEWEDHIQPLLVARFSRATAQQLHAAQACACGGSVIQDMGYHPFGSRVFSQLTLYVRSGYFVQALFNESRDVNDYAFALGALSPYVADIEGHSIAVNRSVGLLDPALHKKYGNSVTWEESAWAHSLTEFGFDTLEVVAHRLPAYICSWTIRTLRERYESDVEPEKLQVVSIVPRVRIIGEGLALYGRGRKHELPLASIRKLSLEENLPGFLLLPRRFRKLQFEGLEINVTHSQHQRENRNQVERNGRRLYPFVIDEVTADGTVLNIFPRRPDKPPHIFCITKLNLHSAGIRQAMGFRATLTNPTPPKLIESTGKFGPWVADDPGKTPVSGSYTFRNAEDSNVASDFHGCFLMRDGVMTFPELAFSLPGSLVNLHGSYAPASEQLDFQGALSLQEATVSQTTPGLKSFLLKAVDPLFEKNGAGTTLPLNITGTPDHLSFKLDIRRAILRR
jgi:hypothetical protein